MKDTLTKENFWNEMEQKYPKAMAHFNIWFKQYRIDNFDDLFIPWADREKEYYELPIAMQLGIFIEYAYYASDEFDGGGVTFTGTVYQRDVKHSIAIGLWWIEFKRTGKHQEVPK